MIKLLFTFLLAYLLVRSILRLLASKTPFGRDRTSIRRKKTGTSPYERKGKYIDYQEVKPKSKS